MRPPASSLLLLLLTFSARIDVQEVRKPCFQQNLFMRQQGMALTHLHVQGALESLNAVRDSSANMKGDRGEYPSKPHPRGYVAFRAEQTPSINGRSVLIPQD